VPCLQLVSEAKTPTQNIEKTLPPVAADLLDQYLPKSLSGKILFFAKYLNLHEYFFLDKSKTTGLTFCLILGWDRLWEG
jgi:hypothetical protein